MTTALSERLRAFLVDKHFMTIATVDPDGSPRQAVIWYTVDGDELIVNSAVGRRWPANLLRDGRVSAAITDHADGYRWLGLTGHAVAVTDQPTAQADIAAMARFYHDDEPDEAEALITTRFERQERISFRIRVDAIFYHLD
jgi:PPOX class probable F420-dependent enzyme